MVSKRLDSENCGEPVAHEFPIFTRGLVSPEDNGVSQRQKEIVTMQLRTASLSQRKPKLSTLEKFFDLATLKAQMQCSLTK